MTDRELILCIPGPWADRSSFLRQVIATEPHGKFLFAGMFLMDVATKDHVEVEFCPADPRMPHSFKVAGQGKIPASCLEQIEHHRSVLYVHFPLAFVSQLERIMKFSAVLRQAGGIAVKLESSGIAHTWDSWVERLNGSLFDVYAAAIVLVGGESEYYSCGMHHFRLPDCALTTEIEVGEAAEIMNRFNFWQINDHPDLKPGDIFALPEKPNFRLRFAADAHNTPDSLFHNSHGVWHLEPTPAPSGVENQWEKPEGEPLFVAISRENPKMVEAYTKAKSSFANFLTAIKSPRFDGAFNSVKIRLRDNDGSVENGEDTFTFLWLSDVSEDGNGFAARVFELPKSGLNNLTEGERVRFSLDDVHDWMLREANSVWGGYTLRVIRENMDAKQRLNYDSYTGILSFRDRLPGA